MKNKHGAIDDDRPIGPVRIIPDYLPPPEELLPPGVKLKVTIELDCDSIRFFKVQARKHGGKYQRMMREVLRRYAEYHSGKKAA